MNRKFLAEKKGEEKELSLLWVAAAAVITLGIVIGIIIFLSASVDMRTAEAGALSNRILRCVIDNGYLRSDFFSADFDIFSACSLDEEIIDKSGKYYIGIEASDESGKNLKTIENGIPDFKNQCAMKNNEKSLASCDTKEIFAFDRDNKKILIKITGASNI